MEISSNFSCNNRSFRFDIIKLRNKSFIQIFSCLHTYLEEIKRRLWHCIVYVRFKWTLFKVNRPPYCNKLWINISIFLCWSNHNQIRLFIIWKWKQEHFFSLSLFCWFFFSAVKYIQISNVIRKQVSSVLFCSVLTISRK
jgi:hypothetical protein